MIGEFRARARARSGVVLWALGEIFIVVAGVLIAFGLNAWWVERSTRAEERTHLRALARDFELNVAIYNAMLEREDLIIKSTLELLQLARTQPDVDPAVVTRLLDGVLASYREQPALDAYDALVNSAGLALIRDDELRSDLAGFAAQATGWYQERYAEQLYLEFMTRFVGKLGYAERLAGDSQRPSYPDLLADPAFQEHLALRHLIEREVAGNYRKRLSEAQDILTQLHQQTGSSAVGRKFD
jgi:hypothetical protein